MVIPKKCNPCKSNMWGFSQVLFIVDDKRDMKKGNLLNVGGPKNPGEQNYPQQHVYMISKFAVHLMGIIFLKFFQTWIPPKKRGSDEI